MQSLPKNSASDSLSVKLKGDLTWNHSELMGLLIQNTGRTHSPVKV